MKTLVTTFTKLSPINKIKFVTLLPIMCFAALVDKLVDLGVGIFQWARYVIKNYHRETVIVLIALLIIATPITLIIHVDRTVHNFHGATTAQAKKYVYTNCHEMTNTFIVAEDGCVRGYVRADDNNIDKLMVVIAEYNFSDEDLLIGWLSEFKKGDYSNAVSFHNYCWEMLDGEIGYAVALKGKYK